MGIIITLSIAIKYEYFNTTVRIPDNTSWTQITGYGGAASATIDGSGSGILFSAASFAASGSEWINYPDLHLLAGYGTNSYANVHLDNVTTNNFELVCRGHCDCLLTQINATSQKFVAKCDGLSSCAYSKINWSPTNNTLSNLIVTGNGALSLYNSYLITNGDGSNVTITLSGFLAGYGLTILCQTGDQCIINCDSAHACYNTTLICDSDSDGICTVNNCNQTRFQWCPISDTSGIYIVQPSKFWLTM